jgi:DNA-binding response OmpR family regulator
MSDNKRILVVEDDLDCRTALCAILESQGFEPIEFPGGKAALAGIGETTFAIALLDIMMPEMNGYELLDELKKLPQFEDIPVIMVTAKDEDNEILEGYKSGADYYITKPFTSKQIEYGLKLFLNPDAAPE